jgi:nucleoside 2-deoxyribosyltransferase
MKIAISASIKFKDLICKVIEDLAALDMVPLFPNIESPSNEVASIDLKKQLALAHYQAIAQADTCYFLTPGGYIGTSCKVELGYALALKKPIYFSEPTDDEALDCYVTKFIPVDQLQLFKSIV